MDRAARRRVERAARKGELAEVAPAAITWFSNSAWAPTGYGTQTLQAVKRLQADGHKVAVASNYGQYAMQMEYDGIPHYPMGVVLDDVVEGSFLDWNRLNPGLDPLLIALYDAWPLVHPAWDRLPVGIWTMVDHLPAPPKVLGFLNKPNVTPLAASKFGHAQIQSADIESLYVPMAIDPQTYKPTATWSNGGRDLTGRDLMGFSEDTFVVSCVNANKAAGGLHRKAWGENLLAFSIFAEGKTDVGLYLHTERHGNYGGVNFDELVLSLDIPKDKFRVVNQWAYHLGIPNESMAAIYTATDVLLAPTYGEGFGLTVLEAGACETPAIVSNFTCQPELVSEDSYLVGGQPFYDSAQKAWWQIPSVQETVAALEAAYARGRYRSAAQREHAQQYDADTVYAQHWRPAIDRLRQKHYSSPAVEPVPLLDGGPLLTIYIPTYKRPVELQRLLVALIPQLTDDVEVIVSDDDPDGTWDESMPAQVRYVNHGVNLGGDENLQRGVESGRGEWVWMVGDDDCVLPGAVSRVLGEIRATAASRLILLSPAAPTGAAGMLGSPAELEVAQPGLTIASSLITANVVRRSALDPVRGREHLDSMYGWAWAHAGIRKVRVLPEPCFEVGADHAGEYIESRNKSMDDVIRIWRDLLESGYGVPFTDSVLAWNHIAVARAARAA